MHKILSYSRLCEFLRTLEFMENRTISITQVKATGSWCLLLYVHMYTYFIYGYFKKKDNLEIISKIQVNFECVSDQGCISWFIRISLYWGTTSFVEKLLFFSKNVNWCIPNRSRSVQILLLITTFEILAFSSVHAQKLKFNLPP